MFCLLTLFVRLFISKVDLVFGKDDLRTRWSSIRVDVAIVSVERLRSGKFDISEPPERLRESIDRAVQIGKSYRFWRV
jgi:hypothetical protein